MKPIKCSNCDSNDMELHRFYWQCNSCLTKHQLDNPIVERVVERKVNTAAIPLATSSTSMSFFLGSTNND